MTSDGVLPTVAVTGSTGGVGGMVAALLQAEGIRQRLLVRNPAKAPRIVGAPVLCLTYADRGASLDALRGVELLFMVSASESRDRLDQHRTFIDAARDAGVRHVVYTSFLNAAPDATFTLARDHFRTEEHVRASGMDFTFLRDSLYMDFLGALVGGDGAIRGPAGSGSAAVVARRDVARVAAAVLRSPHPHRGATYDLTGPEALTLHEVASLLTEATGRAVAFHPETVDEAYASRRRWGAPDWQLDAWVSTYTAIASGEMGPVSGDVERVTGEGPTSLRRFLAEQVPRPT